MTGIQFVTDENGRKVGVQIDLRKHRELWEDIEDGLISESRRKQKGISFVKIKGSRPGIRRIELLGTDPRPSGCKKLRGYADQWRIRVGTWRIVYILDDTARTVNITRIAHRREVYDECRDYCPSFL